MEPAATSASSPSVSPGSTTTYTATATDASGNHASNTVTLNVVGAGALSQIKHIIFFVQENRSFDNYFGRLGPYKAAKGFANLKYAVKRRGECASRS